MKTFYLVLNFFNSKKAAYTGDAVYFYVQYRKGYSTKNKLDKMCLSTIAFNAKLKDFYNNTVFMIYINTL